MDEHALNDRLAHASQEVYAGSYHTTLGYDEDDEAQQDQGDTTPVLLLTTDTSHAMTKVAHFRLPSAATTPAQPSLFRSNDPQDDTRYCRICGEGEEDQDDMQEDGLEEDDPELGHERGSSSFDHAPRHIKPFNLFSLATPIQNPLIHPCHCKGSMAWVHLNCLNRWRQESPRQESYIQCDTCGYRYNIARPKYVRVLANPVFVRLVTLFIVVFAIILTAYLVKVIDVVILHHSPLEDPDWYEVHGPTIWWMDRFYFAVGLLCISLMGFVYLVFHGLRYGLDSLQCCPGGGFYPYTACYCGDCGAAAGGDAAAAGAMIFLVALLVIVVVFGMMGALIGVYCMVDRFVQSAFGKLRERILDVPLD
ncbi:hypothetical protein BZG36_01857 [Bifiguratus adelaidae]|uniref:RING-CH-type domain-containing protein n=1 Tax=Bifiguratus adelaidae TaxID=1938954 RepID=A0A261Y2I8_9FUNG|nr:hypothetical protein BZG36_01857 [Bifiguratus adelaidae]